MKKFLAVILIALAAALVWEDPVVGQTTGPSHMDKSKQSRGCAGCHRGRGTAGTPLLKASMDIICFDCHGNINRRWAKTDIESLLGRPSVHPIAETWQHHRQGEMLPEENSLAPRHVSCNDCHVVHVSTMEKPWKGTKGYAPGTLRGTRGDGPPPGLRLPDATYDYELCYLCHADSANLPLGRRDVGAEFDPNNASYHPVEMEGRNTTVPSLVAQLAVNSRVSCGSCHGNSDVGGPKGPHGSDYAPLLLAEYRTADGPEAPKTYELCYMCHERSSILGDQSFKWHSLHVSQKDTSCYTCHASHGSALNKHLISFNELVVAPSVNSSGPDYFPAMGGMPRCYLNCHGADHNSVDVAGKAWP